MNIYYYTFCNELLCNTHYCEWKLISNSCLGMQDFTLVQNPNLPKSTLPFKYHITL